MDERLIAGIACLFLCISSRLGRLLGNTFSSQAWEPLATPRCCPRSFIRVLLHAALWTIAHQAGCSVGGILQA